MESLKKKAALIIFDVDNFKKVNDEHGHDAGDVCLQTVAKAIRNTYLRYGYCYRIGGDEFCVVIRRGVDLSEVNTSFYQELAHLRQSQEVILPNVSLGCAIFDPEKENIHQAIQKADHEMYEEKNKAKK